MSGQFQEPWRLDGEDAISNSIRIGFFFSLTNGTRVGETFTNCHFDDAECEANARRIVACVNACEGISTAELELEKPIFVQMLMQRQSLQLQLEELLATLKEIKRAADEQGAFTGASFGDISRMADTAIARVQP